eukprot:TRINITY_DN23854_c0_g2_i2.p1 TRINITY_DN23854_c0_g2~~TRINITY_DN23854_c0_g2_i2.p1  ORF type:complete len:1766 (+),score=482.27 TRINITY_DN23854_c0_g2_i2:61-5298(+)
MEASAVVSEHVQPATHTEAISAEEATSSLDDLIIAKPATPVKVAPPVEEPQQTPPEAAVVEQPIPVQATAAPTPDAASQLPAAPAASPLKAPPTPTPTADAGSKSPVPPAASPLKAADDVIVAPAAKTLPSRGASPSKRAAADSAAAATPSKAAGTVGGSTPRKAAAAPATMPASPVLVFAPGKSEPMIGETEEAPAVDYSAEPLAARLASKDLNRRCSAYAELQKRMEPCEECPDRVDSEAFDLFRANLGACVAEALPKGQDAGLSAMTAYLENGPSFEENASHAEELLPVVVRGLLEHKAIDKPKLQQLVPPIILLVAEICECPAVMKETLACLEGLENAKKKTQGFFKKQVTAIIKVIYQLLLEFGVAKMHPKLGYLNVVLKYTSDSDRTLREACYSTLVELSVQAGDISEQVKSLEEPQKKELAKRVAEATSGDSEKAPAKQKRVYRKEKKRLEALGTTAAAKAADEPADVFGLGDAWKRLPKGWNLGDVFSIEKWKDKVKHLQTLSGVLEVPKLNASEVWGSMVPTLVRIYKQESNIPVVVEAAKCVGLLAKGLRKDFEKGGKQLLAAALTRIIDKSVWKRNILVDSVELLLWSVSFDTYFEAMSPHMLNKSMFAKKEAMTLLLRALDLPQVQESSPDAASAYFEGLALGAVPNIDDSDNSVRQHAANFLAVLLHRNQSSPAASTVMSKIPPHRRSTFEDEWKKVSSDPCPAGALEQSISAMSTGSESRTGLKTPRHLSAGRKAAAGGGEQPRATASQGVTRQVSRERLGADGMARQASRERVGAASAVAPSAPKITAAAAAAGAPAASAPPPSAVAPPIAASTQAGIDVQTVLAENAEMAAQIAELRNTVAQLQQQQLNQSSTSDCPPAAEYCDSNASFHREEPQRERRLSAGLGLRPSTPRGDRGRLQRVMSPQKGAGESRIAAPMTPGRDGDGRGRRLSGPSSAVGPSALRPRSSERSSGSTVRTQAAAGMTRSNSAGMVGTSTVAARGLDGSEPFELRYPRLVKAQRQLKERCDYWGPEPIPGEQLAVLKESWQMCVHEGLWRGMFSSKMDDQLKALLLWKNQVQSSFESLAEVLDMMLKWLTWMLFNTNTQIWKQVIEILGGIFSGLAGLGMQLTDREAQILLPNLLEKAGHNIASIRESMCDLLRAALTVYNGLKALPMVIHGLTSKNKRNVACGLRGIGGAMDRQVAAALQRSQKDMRALMGLTSDKDAEVRKLAGQVLATFAMHADPHFWDRMFKTLPTTAQTVVRNSTPMVQPTTRPPVPQLAQSAPQAPAAAPMTPGRAGGAPLRETSPLRRGRLSMSSAALPPATSDQPAAVIAPSQKALEPADVTFAAPPSTATGISPLKSRVRPASPLNTTRSLAGRLSRVTTAPAEDDVASACSLQSTAILRQEASTATPAPVVRTPSEVSSVTSSSATTSPALVLAQQLLHCKADDFSTHCKALVAHARRMTPSEAPVVAETLTAAMRMYFGHDACLDRCWPLADLVDEFCASRECIRPLSTELYKGMLRELMRNLHSNGWTGRLEAGDALLKKLNLSCVLLLQSIPRQTSTNLLLTLGSDESEVVGSALCVKCLKKVARTMTSGRSSDQEVPGVLDVLRDWLARTEPRLAALEAVAAGQRPRQSLSPVDNAVATVLDGVRGLAEAVYRASPNSASVWLQENDEVAAAKTLGGWFAAADEVGEKENSAVQQVKEALLSKTPGGRAQSPAASPNTKLAPITSARGPGLSNSQAARR